MQEVPKPFPKTTHEALKLVATGKFALINDVSQLAFPASEHCKQFVMSHQTFRPVGEAFALHKGSEFMNIFNIK